MLNERGEFKEWVHIWQMGGAPVLSISTWESLPWVRPYGLETPTAGAVVSAYHLNRCADWPERWDDIAVWIDLEPVEPVTIHRGLDPPWYWRVLPHRGQHQLAAWLAGMKRDLTGQLMRDMHASSRNNYGLNLMIRQALEPYLIFPNNPHNNED